MDASIFDPGPSLSLPDHHLLIEALQVSPPQRSNVHLDLILRHIQSVAFFQKLAQENDSCILTECSKALLLERRAIGEFVFQMGDFGSEFYVILQGKVSVLGRCRNDPVQEIAVLESGRSFGELALMQNKRRTASILCITDCVFCTLTAVDYKRILSSLQEKKLSELVKFLSNLPYLNHWSYTELVQLSYYFKERNLRKRAVLYRENDPATDVYIVKCGELELIKTIKPGSGESPKSGTLKQIAHISILGLGELLGVEDTLENAVRSHTAICKTQSASVLVIKKEDFSRTFLNDTGWSQTMKILNVKRRIRDGVFNSFERVRSPGREINSVTAPETTNKTYKPAFSRRSDQQFLRRIQELSLQIKHQPELTSLSPISASRKGGAMPHFPRPQAAWTPPKEQIWFPNPDVIRSHSHHKYPERAFPMKTRTLKLRQHIRNATSHRPYPNPNLSFDLTNSTDRIRRSEFPYMSEDSSFSTRFKLLSIEAQHRKLHEAKAPM